MPDPRRPHRLLSALAILLATALAGPAPAAAAWVWPVSGEVITPYRNGTDPYATGQHRGIDIAAPVGTPVVAAAGGEVRFAGTAGSSGLTIGIRTGDGYDTSYLHLSSLSVRAGAQVSAGDRIGAVGTTGTRSATAPHLHFGVRDAGTRHGYHDPLALLPPPAPPAPAPEPPAAAPAPAPAPAPPAGAPVANPRRAPHPRPVPKGHPRPAPHPAPHRLPHPAPGSRPVPMALPAKHPKPEPRADTRVRPLVVRRPPWEKTPVGIPRQVRRSTSLPPVSLGADPRRAHASSRRQSDVDLGWALACAGLLLAAAVLGLKGDGGTVAKRTGSRLSRVLQRG